MQEVQETQVHSLGWEDPLQGEMVPTPVFLPGESHGQRSLVGYSPWGRKELDMTEQLSAHIHTTKDQISIILLVYQIVHYWRRR